MLLKKFLILYNKFLLSTSPSVIIIIGYLSYIFLGWLLLSLNVSKLTNISNLDILFVTTSAVSTTGLSTISLANDLSFFGQIIVLLLIQVGGIGYMTFTSFLTLGVNNKLTAGQKYFTNKALAKPKKIKNKSIIKTIIVFTILCECLGTALLYILFKRHDVDTPMWHAIFHSISAFCTAGFSTFSNNLTDFRTDTLINIVIFLLSYAGAIGFIVWADVASGFFSKGKNMTFTSKVILKTSFLLFAISLCSTLVFDHHLLSYSDFNSFIISIFHIMSASTTVGFNTIPLTEFSFPLILVLLFLMFFGASPSGTGGGLKTTTLTTLYAIFKSTIRKRSSVRLWKRELPENVKRMATANFFFYIVCIFISFITISIIQKPKPVESFFEIVSALGTVGLSLGFTSELVPLSKLLIIVLMFVGRIGPITFATGITQDDESKTQEKENDLTVE